MLTPLFTLVSLLSILISILYINVLVSPSLIINIYILISIACIIYIYVLVLFDAY